MIDPADSDLTAAVPGVVTFRDPARPPVDAATARYVPADPFDADAYDTVYRWVLRSFPRYVWADEMGVIAPVRRTPPAVRTLLVQGRKRMIGHLALHTRPREVDPNVIAQAEHVAAFALPNPDDRRRLAESAGIPPATLDDVMGGLAEHGFVWWDQRRRRLHVCPPLQIR